LNVLPMNYATAVATLPVIEALLPGGEGCQTNSPGPFGLFGGYPVKISDQKIEMDLPAGVTKEEAIEFNEAGIPDIGIERFDDDGTMHYSEASKSVMAEAGCDPRFDRTLQPPYRHRPDQNPVGSHERLQILSRNEPDFVIHP
jgi:hypothetical protein